MSSCNLSSVTRRQQGDLHELRGGKQEEFRDSLYTIASSLDFFLRDERKLEGFEQKYNMMWLKFYMDYTVALREEDFRAIRIVAE